ncbi:phage tail assembly protein [Aeromonas veronii]|uniref:phage tail assembly protein n=1 Tax=Aeromonas veronii TaxID=654 RepID=UPI002B474643|nr:phage tail assembly protein [Aeromonas veronii]
MNHKEITLSAPIQAHGESLEKLELKKPTGEQVCRLGLPYTMTPEGEVSINMKKVKGYLIELCAIPASAVEQIEPADLNNAAWDVAGFFLKG